MTAISERKPVRQAVWARLCVALCLFPALQFVPTQTACAQNQWQKLAQSKFTNALAKGGAPAQEPVSLERYGKSFPSSDAAADSFAKLVDRFFTEVFAFQPSWSTSAGFHEHDSELEDYAPATISRQIKMLESYLATFQSVQVGSLSRQFAIDRMMLISYIRGRLLSLRDVQDWKRNPDHYSSSISASVFDLVKRNFAPLPERMKLVIARERLIPQVLKEAQQNLEPSLVPKIYVEIALEQLPGIVGFFRDSVPEAFVGVKDAKLQAELAETTKGSVLALEQYQKFLRAELLENGAAKGSFALGESYYRQKLLYEEMVDEPIDSLLERGDRELKRLQQQFLSLAKEIDPKRSAEDTFKDIAKDHPKPDQLLSDVRKVLEKIRAFCNDRNIVTIPGEERPTVEESPPFMRALTFASLDCPGPYENVAKESFYHVTLPEPNWSAERTEEHMRTFSFPDVVNTSVHEAYPGHFVQFLWCKQAPTKTRKLVGCSSNEEGWAHYCEQMMVDEGYGGDNKPLRMVQIHDALLRACRYMVGLRMHTRGMTVEQGVEFFMREGYVERANAERETKRGTMDPTYLVYTLGKLQILALRDEYKKMKGDKFDLKEFHDQFLGVGYPPIKIVRVELLNQPLPQ